MRGRRHEKFRDGDLRRLTVQTEAWMWSGNADQPADSNGVAANKELVGLLTNDLQIPVV